MESLEEGDKLQVGKQSVKDFQVGQICWWYKCEDVHSKGIPFGSVLEKIGSDFLLKSSTEGEAKIPYQRLFLMADQVESIPRLNNTWNNKREE